MYRSLLLLLLILSSCRSSPVYPFPISDAGRDPVREEMSRIFLTIAQKWRFQYSLHIADSTVFFDESEVFGARLDFTTQRDLDLCGARKLLVDITEELIVAFEENQVVPNLGSSDLEINIRFPSFFNKYVDLQYVGLISLKEGIVSTYAADTFDCDGACWHRRREYYWQTKNFVDFIREGEMLYQYLERIPGKDVAPSSDLFIQGRLFSIENTQHTEFA